MTVHRPSSLSEAYAVKKTHPECSYLLGGTSVLAIGGGETDLIDLNRVVPSTISEKNGAVIIGGGVKLEDVSCYDAVPAFIREAAASCPSLQQRNMATIGGNAASCRADGYMTAALLAADALLSVYDGDGERTVSYRDYVSSHGGDCIIVSISIRTGIEGVMKRVSRASHMHAVVTASSCGGCYAYTASPSTIVWGGKDAYRNAEYSDDLLGSADYKRYLHSVIFGGEK